MSKEFQERLNFQTVKEKNLSWKYFRQYQLLVLLWQKVWQEVVHFHGIHLHYILNLLFYESERRMWCAAGSKYHLECWSRQIRVTLNFCNVQLRSKCLLTHVQQKQGHFYFGAIWWWWNWQKNAVIDCQQKQRYVILLFIAIRWMESHFKT